MFYIFCERSDGSLLFMAHCNHPEVASSFRKSGYVVSRCINITKISLAIGHHLKLVK